MYRSIERVSLLSSQYSLTQLAKTTYSLVSWLDIDILPGISFLQDVFLINQYFKKRYYGLIFTKKPGEPRCAVFSPFVYCWFR